MGSTKKTQQAIVKMDKYDRRGNKKSLHLFENELVPNSHRPLSTQIKNI